MKTLFFLILFIVFSSCRMFEKKERLVTTTKNSEGKIVKIYFVTLGATTDDVIQVREIGPGENEILVQAYKHNFLKSCKFLNKGYLQLVLTDSGYYGFSKKMDTVKVNVK